MPSTSRPVGGRGVRRRPRERAGRPVLDPDVVAATALSVLTAEGVTAVTMSRVARELGVSVRAVYHWVPSRAELLASATLLAQESMPLPASTGDWRADLRRHRDETFAWLDAHPGILDVHTVEGIPAVGPRVIAAHEAGLALFCDIGYRPRRARTVYAEYAKWVGATHHYLLRPARGGGPVFDRVVQDTASGAGAEAPLTRGAGTTTVSEQVEDGFDWLLDAIEAGLG